MSGYPHTRSSTWTLQSDRAKGGSGCMYGRAQEANFQEKGGDHAKLAHACCEQATQAGALSWPLPDAFPAHVNCHIGPARAGLTVELQPLPCWKVKNPFARTRGCETACIFLSTD